MAQLALALKKKSINEKTTLATAMVTSLTGNNHFPTPNPALTAITAAVLAILAKQAAIKTHEAQGDTLALELDALEAALDALLTTLGKYIENTSGGDPIQMASSGAPLKGASSPIGKLAAPANLRLTGGDKDGELDAMWDPRHGASSYQARYGTTANGPWTEGYAGTPSKCTLTGLTSGAEYFVQVCAIGTAGESAWSDIARKRAT